MIFQMQSILIVLIEVICCKIFFETFAEKKEGNRHLPCAVIVGMAGIICFLAYLLKNYFLLKELLIVVITAILMKLYLDLRITKSLVLAVLYQSIDLVVDYCGVSIISYFFSGYEKMSEQYLPGGSLIIAFCKICLFLVILLINQKMKNKSTESLTDNEWLRFLFFPVFTIGIIAAMLSDFKYVDKPEQANLLFVIAFGMVGMNIVVFFLLNDILVRESRLREEKVFLLEARNQTKMYQSISENFEKQRKKTHEYKNQIMCIEGLLKQNRYDKAEEYISGISGGLSLEMDTINTNHVIVNAILNTKYREAAGKGIVLAMKVNDLSGIWMEDTDIVVILSNLLDNAIEATEKCQENRIIKLKFIVEENIIISVKNTYSEKPIMQNGKLVTSKSEKEEHGIGTQNIIDTVKKYNGSYVIKEEEKEFLFSIFIPKV